MTLPGECVNDTTTICHECGAELNIDIQKSAAGYYAADSMSGVYQAFVTATVTLKKKSDHPHANLFASNPAPYSRFHSL